MPGAYPAWERGRQAMGRAAWKARPPRQGVLQMRPAQPGGATGEQPAPRLMRLAGTPETLCLHSGRQVLDARICAGVQDTTQADNRHAASGITERCRWQRGCSPTAMGMPPMFCWNSGGWPCCWMACAGRTQLMYLPEKCCSTCPGCCTRRQLGKPCMKKLSGPLQA